jgi:hypothetical protein
VAKPAAEDVGERRAGAPGDAVPLGAVADDDEQMYGHRTESQFWAVRKGFSKRSATGCQTGEFGGRFGSPAGRFSSGATSERDVTWSLARLMQLLDARV